MGRAREAERIAWDELARDATRDRNACARVAESWNFRSKQEHLAVGASIIAHELADEGCEPIVLSLITRASNDEVRHAEICARMWSALRSEPFVPARFRGTPTMQSYSDTPASMRALFHVVELCCISETFTSVAFTEMLSRTTHPIARAVVQSLLTDEIDHGRVGWAYIAERAKGNALHGLSVALPDIFVRAMGAGMRPAEKNAEPDDASLEHWGYLGPKTVADIFRSTAREVILPGFERFGVDTARTRSVLETLEWV
jgi:hypothetical protein